MTPLQSCKHRLSLHGLVVDLDCDVPALNVPIYSALGGFTVTEWPDGFMPITGTVRPYDETVVLRHLSPNAVAIAEVPGMELYQDGERFWLIDDRWGLCEMNLLKGQWQSWILPEPAIEPMFIAELAVMWPLAQLVRNKGLHLLPAAAVAREGWGMLLISPFGIEPELTALAQAGYKLIGQRWTALREEDGRVAMLHMPGAVERLPAPALRIGGVESNATWVNLTEEFADSAQHHAFCDAVVMVEPGRRPLPRLRELHRANAVAAVRQSWPIIELHPQRRHGQFPPKLAQICRCYHAQLSRKGMDLLYLIDQARYGRSGAPRKLQVTVSRVARQVPA